MTAMDEYGSDSEQPRAGYGHSPVRRRLGSVMPYVVLAAVAASFGSLAVVLSSGNGTPGASLGSGSGEAGTSSGAGISSAAVQRAKNAVGPGLVVINSRLQDDGDIVGASGTGMIISKSGLVLTNNHVIDDTDGLTATVVSTGKTYQALWLGYDKSSDIAVIQLEGASGLSPVPLGNSAAVRVGDEVVAMGNANGAGSITTVTGAVTGLNQAVTTADDGDGEPSEYLTGMLQTDADVVQGDSGGPLASTAGQVIGMDTAALTEPSASDTTVSQQDTAYAIPINKAMTIARQIIADKPGPGVHVGATGAIGVLVAGTSDGGQSTQASPQAQLRQMEESALSPGGSDQQAPVGCLSNAAEAGIPQRIAPVASGTLVLGAFCDSPAATAGLTAGDVITAVAGKQVSSPASLTGILANESSGKKITIVWVTSAGQTVTRAITLAQVAPQ
jgi:S1-C subfamily serine protease